jgi:mono/diheme cytochrome c family protein
MRARVLLLAAAAALLSLSARAEVDAKAAKTFKSKCASCHGAAGKGDTEMGKKLKVPDFGDAGFQAKATDAGLKATIQDGKKGDKVIEDHAFGAKVGDQLDNLVKVVRSFGGK